MPSDDPLRDRDLPPPPGGWETLARREVMKEPYLHISAETVRTGQGKVLDTWWILHFPDWVMVVPVTEAGELVLLRQWRQGVRAVSLEVPGGTLEEGETDPLATGARELLEETGYEAAELRSLGFLWPDPSRNANRCHMVLALGCRKVAEPVLEPGESIESFTVPMAEAKAMLLRGDMMSTVQATTLMRGLAELGEL
ncbi:NUDIX hydrolase [Rhodovarius crocodyli]|uniref:GDP-mannose pyrophosphatase n=1 Tax=Rhodovarius crocodyli TaxID=1979269 RepID=A0A437LZ01_9PROT|nr:NUDIX hydrolase [Rhodovarius crocodyli]RVT90617.1 NUDIX hydrolase [Rhodovarius crocodyli]